MSKVNLTFSESKTKDNLSLESKDAGLTWDEADWTWNEATSSWNAPKMSASLESKTKVDLVLESK